MKMKTYRHQDAIIFTPRRNYRPKCSFTNVLTYFISKHLGMILYQIYSNKRIIIFLSFSMKIYVHIHTQIIVEYKKTNAQCARMRAHTHTLKCTKDCI